MSVALFEPMLATTGYRIPVEGWTLEPKLDGWREIICAGPEFSVRTRRGRDITPAVPELAALTDAIGNRSAVLDGELVVGDGRPGDFYALLPRMARGSGIPVCFAAFDLLELDDEPMISRRYDERRAQLVDLVRPGPAWTVIPAFTDIEAGFIACVQLGLEGAVARGATQSIRAGTPLPTVAQSEGTGLAERSRAATTSTARPELDTGTRTQLTSLSRRGPAPHAFLRPARMSQRPVQTLDAHGSAPADRFRCGDDRLRVAPFGMEQVRIDTATRSPCPPMLVES